MEKLPKPRIFYAVPAHQGVIHGVKDGLDGEFGVAVGQLAEAGSQLFNEVGTRHEFREGEILGNRTDIAAQTSRSVLRCRAGCGANTTI